MCYISYGWCRSFLASVVVVALRACELFGFFFDFYWPVVVVLCHPIDHAVSSAKCRWHWSPCGAESGLHLRVSSEAASLGSPHHVRCADGDVPRWRRHRPSYVSRQIRRRRILALLRVLKFACELTSSCYCCNNSIFR